MTTLDAYASVRQLRAQLESRALSAEELTRAHLARIDALDDSLGCFLHVDRDGALAQARAVDERRVRGEDCGSLAGIPVALKDALVTRGVPTTAASKILAGWIPPYDATVVERLRAAGAVLLGKLNMDEFAMGSSTEHSSVRPCRNPWNRDRVPGGSSGGSAAAVAAGLCTLSLGSDTGGSIRQPAALCGITGLKPTYGRVSRYGLIAFASSLDQVGPLARSAEDLAEILGVISGADPRDATSLELAVPDYAAACHGGVKGLRIGRALELDREEVAPAIRRAVDAAIDALVAEGAEVVSVSLPHIRHSLAAYYLIAPAEASSNLARFDGVRYGHRESVRGMTLQEMYARTRGAGFGREVKRRIMLGTFALRAGHYDAYYKKAQQVRALIRDDFARAFERVDVIASPTTPTTAFALGAHEDPMDMYRLDIFTLACNLAGLPGMSVPCGFDDESLPIGMQLLAAPLGEETLLRTAAHFQRITDFHQKHPSQAVAA